LVDIRVKDNVISLANGAKGPGKPSLGQELGVPHSMPFGSFTDWLTGESFAPNTALVSLDKLVEMRQKDSGAPPADDASHHGRTQRLGVDCS
jgi:hypothetical protein